MAHQYWIFGFSKTFFFLFGGNKDGTKEVVVVGLNSSRLDVTKSMAAKSLWFVLDSHRLHFQNFQRRREHDAP